MEQTVSFSKKVKKELSDIQNTCVDCALAETYGMMLFGRCFNGKTVSFSTEHKAVADRLVANIVDVAAVIVTIKYFGSRYHKGVKVYYACVEDEVDSELLRERFPSGENFLESDILKNDCCKVAFLRGAFMACGSITEPEKEYHLEFVVQSEKLANDLKQFIELLNLPIKLTIRKNTYLLYLKESEFIEDILTLMGAIQSSMGIMNVKIIKDVRNKVNRVTNCETANIGKTVMAATKQIEDIRYIKDNKGLSYLSDDLKEIAEIRLNNPDLSLRELCDLLGSSISKSGVNHRLKRIQAIADDLRTGSVNQENE